MNKIPQFFICGVVNYSNIGGVRNIPCAQRYAQKLVRRREQKRCGKRT